MSGINTCPASVEQLLNCSFIEHRAKLLDLSSFLDRISRAEKGDVKNNDVRLAKLYEALMYLAQNAENPQSSLTEHILLLFSDKGSGAVISDKKLMPAIGAYKEKSNDPAKKTLDKT